MGEEVWKTMVYNGVAYDRFEVSTCGRMRNVKTGTVYKLTKNHNGYLCVCVSLGSRNNKKLIRVHKAVAETFIGNPQNKNLVNHKDGDKTNDCVDNLEWVTDKENTRHAWANGLAKAKQGTESTSSKLNADQVRFIREHYKPRDKVYGSVALGRMFGINSVTILNVVHYISYVNVI